MAMLALLSGLSKRVLTVRGHTCIVAVRPPCVPQTPEPGQVCGQAGHLGDTGMAETGHISGALLSSVQCIHTNDRDFRILINKFKYRII